MAHAAEPGNRCAGARGAGPFGLQRAPAPRRSRAVESPGDGTETRGGPECRPGGDPRGAARRPAIARATAARHLALLGSLAGADSVAALAVLRGGRALVGQVIRSFSDALDSVRRNAVNRSFARALVLLLLVAPPCSADDFGAGWRGNWTGLWPNAKPPLEWHRLPKGVLTDLRARTDKPAEKEGEKGNRIEDGLVHDWLVLGPFPVGDSVKDFDRAQLDVEKVRPGIGDRDRGLTWQRVEVPPEDPMAFGKVDLPWLDFLPTVGGFKPNQVAYAHTYLYTPRGGTVRAVVEHAHGLKAWVNGKEVYSSPNRGLALGNYVNLSRHELNHWNMPSPRFDVPLRAGWNRLLLKVSTSNKDD